MTSHSKSAIEYIRKLLFNYDLMIAATEAKISLNQEIMDLTISCTDANSKKKFVSAKIDLENNEVFLFRLKKQKKDLLEKVGLIAKKYDGQYAEIFNLYYFEYKTPEEISELTGLKEKTISRVIKRMDYDIISFK